jgi:asparagine synthetase B (glutamine-hydrolysing)
VESSAFSPPAACKQETLAAATQSLRHRGPDDSGTTIIPIPSGGELGLAHTRLSIIDLSPLGQQPMRDPVDRQLDRLQRRDLQLPRTSRAARIIAALRFE